MYILSYDIAATIIVVVLILIHVILYPLNDKGNRLYRTTLFILLLEAITDILSALAIDRVLVVTDGVNLFLNSLYMTCAMLVAFLAWSTIAAHINYEKKSGKILNYSCLTGYSVLLIINAFTGCIFSFKDGVYSHGPLYLANYAVSMVFVLHGAYILITQRTKFRTSIIILDSSFVIIPITCAIIQYAMQKVLLTVFASALAGLLMCFSLETPDYQRILKLIEELRKAKEEETEAKEEALKANEAKSTFLANMSHDMRTPLNAVLGLNTLILRESNEEVIRGYSKDIKSAGDNLLALINDILDLSKVESGKMELVEDTYDLREVLKDVITMVSLKAADKGLELNMEVSPNIPAKLYGDAIRIRQILVNLMNNAVKYTKEGSITLKITAEKGARNVSLHVAIEDTGVGVKKEDLPKLFASFERIDEKNSRGIEGSGLGLSIVGQLLTLMGSKINVESVYGEGSTFSFVLKQRIMDDTVVGDISEYVGNAEEDCTERLIAPDAKVLVVDDNDMNRKVFRSLLAMTKVNITDLPSGYEAVKLCREEKFDIIFMDHLMPEMDGVEALHHIKSFEENLNYKTPVIILTANALAGARDEYIAEGFNDYLEKPVEAVKLEAMLGKFLPKEKVKKRSKTNTTNSIVSISSKDAVSSFPNVEGFRFDIAYDAVKSTDMLLNMIGDFVKISASYGSILEDKYDILFDADEAELPEAFKQYRVQVHSMKSTAAMVGAIGLSEIAKMLEYAAKDEQLEPIVKLNGLFLRKWEEATNSLIEAFHIEIKYSSEKVDMSKLKVS